MKIKKILVVFVGSSMAVTVRTKGHIEGPASISIPARPAVPAIPKIR
jgi:hypothetical protein